MFQALMTNIDSPVVFFDSGAGGLPYFRAFRTLSPHIDAVYVADREGFPYGGKPKEEIVRLLIRLAAPLVERFTPRAAVLACNTASVSALDALRESFPSMPWVGTVPAIKPAVTGSRARRVGVIGTCRTVEDPYIALLAERYASGVELIRIAAPDIVRFVEDGGEYEPLVTQKKVIAPYIERFRKAGADALVLGCTHFLLLLDAFRALCAPDITVYDSVDGVSRRIDKVAHTDAPSESGEGSAILLLTGDGDGGVLWEKRARAFGLEMGLFKEMFPPKEGGQS